MRREIVHYLAERPEEKAFVRLHPEWYRRLARSPRDVAKIKAASDYFYGRTFVQRMDRLAERAGMISLLVSLLTEQGDPNETSGKDNERHDES